MNEDISRLTSRLKQSRCSLDAKAEEIVALEFKNRELRALHSEKDKLLESAQSKILQLNAQIDELNGVQAQLRASRSELVENRHLQLRMRGKEETLTNALTELGMKNVKMEEKKNLQLKEFDKLRRSLESQLEQSKSKAGSLEAQLQETKSELQDTKSELQDTKSELQDTKSELQDTKSELQDTKSELQETKSQLQDTKSELQKTKSELQKTQSELQKTQSEQQKAKSQLHESESKASSLESKLQEKKKTIKELGDKLASLLMQLNDAKSSNEMLRRQKEELRRLNDKNEKEFADKLSKVENCVAAEDKARETRRAALSQLRAARANIGQSNESALRQRHDAECRRLEVESRDIQPTAVPSTSLKDWENVEAAPSRRLIVLGGSGSGRSSVANSILGHREFAVSESLAGGPSVCRSATSEKWTVTDTPSFNSLVENPRVLRDLLEEMESRCESCVLLLVQRLDMQLTNEQRQMYTEGRRVFGEKFHRAAVLVFTHADAIDCDEEKFGECLRSLEEVPEMRELLSLRRCVMIDSREPRTEADGMRRETQVEKLIQMAGRAEPLGVAEMRHGIGRSQESKAAPVREPADLHDSKLSCRIL